MTSIFDNGGVIGKSTYFYKTSSYTKTRTSFGTMTSGTLTREEVASTTVASFSTLERGQNAILSCDVKFPASPAAGVLFEMGGGGVGFYMGMIDTNTFVVSAGDGATPQSAVIAAIFSTTNIPKDNLIHNVTIEIIVNPGKVTLWIDGVLIGTGVTSGGGPLEGSNWCGTESGAYLLASSTPAAAGGYSVAAWSGGTVGASGLRYYQNQTNPTFSSSTYLGSSNDQNSGTWNLQTVEDALLIKGQQEYTTPGTYTWVAPPGVHYVCAVCVGGGGGGLYYNVNTSAGQSAMNGGAGGALAWRNNIRVFPGTAYTVTVGAGGVNGVYTTGSTDGGYSRFYNVNATGGGAGRYTVGATGGSFTGEGGGNGGSTVSSSNSQGPTGGGGAGGYTGNGGSTTTTDYSAGSGGGGAGGNGASIHFSGGGGGVGIYGQGASGTSAGAGGSGGANGTYNGTSGSTSPGGSYGGGGGGSSSVYYGLGGSGGGGAVRIIWGAGRAFPSTRTADE